MQRNDRAQGGPGKDEAARANEHAARENPAGNNRDDEALIPGVTGRESKGVPAPNPD